jgi:hypothetical protein
MIVSDAIAGHGDKPRGEAGPCLARIGNRRQSAKSRMLVVLLISIGCATASSQIVQ